MTHRFAICAAVLAALTVLVACSGEEQATSRSIEEIHRDEGVPVRVRSVEPTTFRAYERFTATVTGATESTATATLSDEVAAVRVEVGDFVQRDATVIEFPLDNPTLNYEQARVTFESARTAFQRVEQLFEDNGVSRQTYDDARTQLDLARANWNAVQSIARVGAPIAGFITRINVVESENVFPGDPLFTVSDYRSLRSTVWLTDRQVRAVAVGQRATAEWQGVLLEGAVTQVDIAMNQDRMAFGARVRFQNPERAIPSGVTAEIEIETYRNDRAVVLNQREVVDGIDGRYVYVVAGDAASRQPVTLSRQQGLLLEVADGLAFGEEVVVQGIDLVDDGTPIQVVGREARVVQNGGE